MINYKLLNLFKMSRTNQFVKRDCSTKTQDGIAALPENSHITRIRIWKSGYFSGCKLLLMSRKIEKDPSSVKENELHLKHDGTYVARYNHIIHTGSIFIGKYSDTSIGLDGLDEKISNKDFIEQVLKITSERDHTQSAAASFVHTSVGESFLAQYKEKGREPNIGHVSIETGKIYASLWPDGINVLNKYKKQPGNLERSPERDELSEGRPPDHLVDLHTLNVDNIEKELGKYDIPDKKYHLFGSNRLIKRPGVNSCTGLAYDLLVSGGIKKLIRKTNLVREYFVTTPNNLAQLVLEAEKNEQESLKITNSTNKL